MTEFSPNKQQKELIENTEGIYLVDAGAGTGKTFAITRRYINILEDQEPEDIFLATFTRNAADEMKERISQKSGYRASEIFDAPISTFHAHCQKILERNGHEAPQILGIDEYLTEDVRVLESQIRERQEFEDFISNFKQRHEEHQDFFRIVRDDSNLLSLLKSIAAKGIMPENNSWFGDTEKYLDGDFDEFKQLFEEKNKPIKENGGSKQSELRRRLYSYKWKNFDPDAPSIDDIRGGYGTKQVRKDFCEKAFQEDREELKQFVHDLYTEYLEYCLSRNYLNFSFLMALTYALLHKKPQIREEESFEYIMIDEFQDTNEIQFKLALLLADKPNFCVVGDWKQSIYSFQYAAVENILEFEDRLEKYSGELNGSQERVNFSTEEVEKIELKKNYRSTQEILDISEKSLSLPANSNENPETPEITSLESETGEDGEVLRIEAEDEIEAVLTKIQELKQEESFDYSDIAVLARTRSFGLDLQQKARNYNISAAYEGGVELFTTNPAIVLLAWLRILQDRHSRRGWAVVLEEAGYKLEEAEKILEEGDYPINMLKFELELQKTDSVEAVAEKVFERYGYRNGFTEKIIEVLGDTFSSTYMNLGQLINFIEENIEEGEIYEVDSTGNENAVTIQTIHAAKGLEYPAVFISDVNRSKFPSTNGFSPCIIYKDPIGLRQCKKFLRNDYAYSFDNWRTEILEKCLSGEYDEERRLMYVAMTRAEKNLYITADEEKASTFFTELDIEKVESRDAPEKVEEENGERKVFQV
ncbi:UvrD-helicase domain-containing protein [Candidatus Nanohalobium constans]|uniref:DNA 3'-5' helicase n=1 Tax=Candidatus Nanohalobium constans TaxID=2565781 RepID=A0A5Q0UFW5_9ARCH|nr:ATP-dependent helicase [Candidatus Nanohalobium constans]QGA80498.1 DNA helicase II / ATP-dependent DNA helicase PcrA [Candidatus Nanohalobium constans]